MTIGNAMTELEQLEQELSDLRHRLEQSFEVFDTLAGLQAQFAELVRTHQAFKRAIAEAQTTRRNDLNEFQETVNQRLAALEQAIVIAQAETRAHIQESVNQRCAALEAAILDLRTKAVNPLQETLDQRFMGVEKLIEAVRRDTQDQLTTLRSEVTAADQNLNTSLLERANQLKQEVSSQITVLSHEWIDPKAVLQESLQTFEQRITADLKTAIRRLQQNGFNASHLERLNNLDTQLRVLKGSLTTSEQHLRVTRHWLIAAIATVVVALSFPIYLLASGRMNLFPSSDPASTQESWNRHKNRANHS